MDSQLSREDIERISALVDGELPPAERAALAARIATDRNLARAHATLARVKAAVDETAVAADGLALALPRFVAPRRYLGYGAAAALAVLIVSAFVWQNPWRQQPVYFTPNEGPVAITLAALPSATAIPVLEGAGLKLMGLSVETLPAASVLVANYQGPHGCRLELRAFPAGSPAPSVSGTSRRQWTVEQIGYELTAHGMPEWRFAIVADVAEQQTRHNGIPGSAERRLREARAAAPPCAG
jgi:anti-sigma factor RsiW